jgi:hypothetical protein
MLLMSAPALEVENENDEVYLLARRRLLSRGFLKDYPDYQTQGMSKEGLVNNLKDLLADLESGEIPYIRKVEELVLAD